jgi:hypothetical protein
VTFTEAAKAFCEADAAFKRALGALRAALAQTDSECPVYKDAENGKVESRRPCSTCGGSGTHPYGDPCFCDGGYVFRTITEKEGSLTRFNRCFRVNDYDDWCDACHLTQEFAVEKKQASLARGVALRRMLQLSKRQEPTP